MILVNKTQKPQNSNAIPNDDHVFRYDFENNEHANLDNTATYSNLPSPSNKDNANSVPKIVVPPPSPPLVFRELKPGRKTSESNISNELSPTVVNRDVNPTEHVPFEPPSINRKLKPPLAKPPVEGKQQIL